MCHSLCGLSIYWLKAQVREMSTLPKLNFGHGPPLPLTGLRNRHVMTFSHMKMCYTSVVGDHHVDVFEVVSTSSE